MAPKPTLQPRKAPRQARARATVEAILEAAAQLFVEEGVKTSTNRIAQRAGVSIGSLYQYFPNKEAILVALGERLATRQLETLQKSLSGFMERDIQDHVPEIIEAIMEAKAIEPELCRIVLEEADRLAEGNPMADWLRSMEQIVQAALQMRADVLAGRDAATTAFIIVHAVHGIINSMVMSRPEMLNNPTVRRETAALVLRYLEIPAEGRVTGRA